MLAGNAALPATLVPLKSELLDERRRPLGPPTRQLLPLYRARGYYGPHPNDWDEQEYDIASPDPKAPTYVPSAFSAPSGPAPSPSYAPAPSYAPKRVKLLKVKESPRKKKIIRKRKPKRVVNNIPPVEDELPVSNFHEQFYSDIENTGTIKKIRKPKRVEKIIDGDTEHIHTYSEEHIHKVVFDDGPKLTGLAGGDALGSIPALAAAHPLVPIKNHQSLLAVSAGSLGTPSQLEYAAYNPREVTHDHVIHDHGELPPNVDLLRDSLGYPPKASYTSSGVKLNGRPIKSIYRKPTRPTPLADFSYYESMYDQNGRPKKQRYPLRYNSDPPAETSINDFRPIPAFNFKDNKPKRNPAVTYYGHGTGKLKYPLGQASVPVPFSATASTAQDYAQANIYPGTRPASPTGFSNFKDPFSTYKNAYPNNFGLDTYASSSNFNNRGNDAQNNWPAQNSRGKQKSISSQNVNFGGQDHQTVVDHLAESSQIQSMYNKDGQSQNKQFEGFDDSKPIETATPTTHFTITENSPAHGYYTAMAEKAFQEDPLSLPEASNDHYQYAAAPETTPESLIATAEAPRPFHLHQNAEESTPSPSEVTRKAPKRRRQRNKKPSTQVAQEHPQYSQPAAESRPARARRPLDHHTNDDPSVRGKLKYGDKIWARRYVDMYLV